MLTETSSDFLQQANAARDADSVISPVDITARPDYDARARGSLNLMFIRQFGLQGLGLVTSIILARRLTTDAFGMFAIATFAVETMRLLGDFGLAPFLVQRRAQITERDLQIAFTFQQVLLGMASVALWAGAPIFLRLYHRVDPGAVWLIRVLAFNLFVMSWRSASVLQMERELLFHKVALIEIAEGLLYQLIAVTMLLCGFGIWSLVFATLIPPAVGALLAYLSHPWRIRLAWDWHAVKNMLRFGLPFQGTAIIDSLGGWVTPVIMGGLLGPGAVGYLLWSKNLATKPTQALNPLRRVSFAHFSRHQDSPKALRRAYAKYIEISIGLFGAWAVAIILFADRIVPVVYGDKWVPAVLAVKVGTIGTAFWACENLSHLLAQATGRPGITAKFAVVRSLLVIVFACLLVRYRGFIAEPIAWCIVTAVLTLAISQLLRGVVGWELELTLLRASAAGVAAAALNFVVRPILGPTLLGTCFEGLLAISVFSGLFFARRLTPRVKAYAESWAPDELEPVAP